MNKFIEVEKYLETQGIIAYNREEWLFSFPKSFDTCEEEIEYYAPVMKVLEECWGLTFEGECLVEMEGE